MNGRLSPGDGLIHCSLDRSGRATLSELQFSYPLKFLAPDRRFGSVQVVWVVGYGGGLVAGDRVRVKSRVDKGSTLVLFTQGSTKVFKTRLGQYLSDTNKAARMGTAPPTIQQYRIAVSPASFLVLLPSPVTCFSRALYEQKQVVHLEDETASVILLDWFTSGRMGIKAKTRDQEDGEAWEFEKYRSENEVWIAGQRVAKDVLLLQDEQDANPTQQLDEPVRPRRRLDTTYRHRVEPYSCYASLFLYGPRTSYLQSHISNTFTQLTQYHQSRPYSLLWSYSPLERGGGVARCAGHSTEAVKEWVCELLEAGGQGVEGGIESIVGKDLWKTAFN
ncbi:urease accessory protein UreD [Sporobolomyces koalae]|uniref:urease accessory protein UreD n=1 Tax=Sporobolomyces koalae TaxID=500713 RepID=UPI00317BAFBA